jgi:predicted GNAT superfamily acetyltransferase
VRNGHTIRPFSGIDELKACVALQEETWGHGFSERVPTAILKVAQILGGVAAGAWNADGGLDGFVFGMTGVRDGEVVHWSDMLAVRRGLRDTGLGTRMKAYQRETLLAQGVRKMYWTFDPLQSRNAHVNFSKLGIVVREYAQDMYGETDSPLHHGIGTDRFIALWLMDSERVVTRMSGAQSGSGVDADTELSVGVALASTGPADDPDPPRPGAPTLGLGADVVRVAIPADVSRLMAGSMELAVSWRETTRRALTHYLDRGYEVREFVRGTRTSDYLLMKRTTP